MLQNINILAGNIPRPTGNATKDAAAALAHAERLQRALEMLLDCLDNAQEETERRVRSLEQGAGK